MHQSNFVLCNELVIQIIGLQRVNLGNYYVSRDLRNKLVLRGGFIINMGN